MQEWQDFKTQRRVHLVAAALLIAAVPSCRWCDYGSTPPPTIENLVFEAIALSQQQLNNLEQELSVEQGTAQVDQARDAFEQIPAPPQVFIEDGEPLVNQEFVETDIREALFLMSTDAEVNIVLDDRIRGVVNTSLVDLPFEAALDKVLLPFGYVYAKRDGQYFIGSADPESALFPHIAEQLDYIPKHLATKELIDSLPARHRVFVHEVDSANMLVVEAPPKQLAAIRERLLRVDQPVPQVVLEAIVCVVSPDCGFRFGIDWNHSAAVNGSELFRFGSEGLTLTGIVTPQGLRHVFDDFAATTAFVKLLEEHGYLTIRAAPRVMARDGEQANISIARETWFSVQPISATASGDNSALFIQNDIEKVESGIVLDITPRIRGDEVTVHIERAEVSEDIRNANPEVAVNPFPVINRRSVSTTVHVQDGKTIVIGGLVQQQIVDRESHVPGFSSLPIFGKLFRTIDRRQQDAEVVIFISPRIVTPAVAMERPEPSIIR